MGCAVNNSPRIVSLKVILKGVGDIHNNNGEVGMWVLL